MLRWRPARPPRPLRRLTRRLRRLSPRARCTHTRRSVCLSLGRLRQELDAHARHARDAGIGRRLCRAHIARPVHCAGCRTKCGFGARQAKGKGIARVFGRTAPVGRTGLMDEFDSTVGRTEESRVYGHVLIVSLLFSQQHLYISIPTLHFPFFSCLMDSRSYGRVRVADAAACVATTVVDASDAPATNLLALLFACFGISSEPPPPPGDVNGLELLIGDDLSDDAADEGMRRGVPCSVPKINEVGVYAREWLRE